jgi:hypothetical protein
MSGTYRDARGLAGKKYLSLTRWFLLLSLVSLSTGCQSLAGKFDITIKDPPSSLSNPGASVQPG